jgi:hypothetical protein
VNVTDFFDYLPDNWGNTERELYTGAFEDTGAYDDRTAQVLFNEGYFNFDIGTDERVAIRNALDEYLMDEYGLDFDAVFDWDAWRDAYEGD